MPEATPVFAATGKRKSAIARVQLKLGQGQILVNGKPVADYFPRESHQILLRKPFETAESASRYDVIASIRGGGLSGQAGALLHGIARAIEKADPGKRIALKRAGMLTRDSRKKERKKYGQKGARARFQFSKR